MTDLPSIWSWHQTPAFKIIVGLIIFYVGLKMFASGMKAQGKVEQLEWFTHNPYWMFLGGIVCTLLWQSSSLSTTAIVGLVASGILPLPAAIAAVLGANIGTTGTIWLAGIFISDGMPKGETLRIAMAHTGVNLFMAITLLPFVHPIARFLSRFQYKYKDMQNLVSIDDLTKSDIEILFYRVEDIKNNPRRLKYHLQDKILANLFYEPSTRTSSSFAAAMYKLGGK